MSIKRAHTLTDEQVAAARGRRLEAMRLQDIEGNPLDAEQVVYLHIGSASLYPQPGLLEPKAELWVKVIDVVKRRRGFPSTGSTDGSSDYLLTPKGYHLAVKLLPRGAGEQNPSVDRARRQKLASRIARDAARLFYDHLPRQPGEPFE